MSNISSKSDIKEKPKIPKGEKYIPAKWVGKLYESIDNIRDLTYLMFHIETGIRVSDVIGSEIVHIDWDNNRINIYDYKKDKWRLVYFPSKIVSQLKMWLEYRKVKGIKDKQLFPFSAKTANRILKKWCKQIGFPLAHLVSSHWCRHTFIKLSRSQGRDLMLVKQNTGDTIQTILSWYSILSSDELRNEIEKDIIKNDVDR